MKLLTLSSLEQPLNSLLMTHLIQVNLFFAGVGIVPIHVVVSINEANHAMFIVTAYEPDKRRWKDNYKRRKK